MLLVKKILIIDDEADIRFLLKRALSHNYSIIEAGNLKQGLELFTENSPDIVILDVNLPDGSGIYYARKFKNDTNMVIFISADNDKLTEGFKDVGANGFLKKPFVIDQLLAVINQIQTNTSNLN